MGFIGAATGIVIGIFLYAEIESSVDCPNATISIDGNEKCSKAKSIPWSVIAILPIALFFGLFSLFGGLRRR